MKKLFRSIFALLLVGTLIGVGLGHTHQLFLSVICIIILLLIQEK